MPGHSQFMWNCLAVALKRAGQYDMAERAYRWGLCCHFSHAPDTHAELLKNAMMLQFARENSAIQMREINPSGVDAQRRRVYRNEDGSRRTGLAPTIDMCENCKTAQPECKACSGCKMVLYCSRSCQVQHWPTHKTMCKMYGNSS